MFREAWNNHAISHRLESVVCLEKNVWWDLGHVSCPRIIQVIQLVFRGYLWFQEIWRMFRYIFRYHEWNPNHSRLILFYINQPLLQKFSRASYFSEHLASSDSTCLKSMFFGVSPKSEKCSGCPTCPTYCVVTFPFRGEPKKSHKKVPGFVKWSPVWETFCQEKKKAALTCDLFSEFNKFTYKMLQTEL